DAHEKELGARAQDAEGEPRVRVKVVEAEDMVRVSREGMARAAAAARAPSRRRATEPTAPAPWTAPGCASPPGSEPGASAPDGGQVVADPVDGVDQDLHRRQGDQPEVVVGAQVEAGALRDQQLAGPQQVVGE